MELHATRLASISCAIKSPSEEGLDRNFLEVAGVEAPSKLSQELGTLENGAFIAQKNTCTAPLSDDASSQMLASIVSNWHRLPDDLKRKMAELTGL
jgi:hypothetical protein